MKILDIKSFEKLNINPIKMDDLKSSYTWDGVYISDLEQYDIIQVADGGYYMLFDNYQLYEHVNNIDYDKSSIWKIYSKLNEYNQGIFVHFEHSRIVVFAKYNYTGANNKYFNKLNIVNVWRAPNDLLLNDAMTFDSDSIKEMINKFKFNKIYSIDIIPRSVYLNMIKTFNTKKLLFFDILKIRNNEYYVVLNNDITLTYIDKKSNLYKLYTYFKQLHKDEIYAHKIEDMFTHMEPSSFGKSNINKWGDPNFDIIEVWRSKKLVIDENENYDSENLRKYIEKYNYIKIFEV